MDTHKNEWIEPNGDGVRAVNSKMVLAYWLIGREIVQEIQGGEECAEYGNQVVSDRSSRLTKKYKKGFSVTHLLDFRKFYQAYLERLEIEKECRLIEAHALIEDEGE